jgi:hypothetical protein
LNYKRYSKPKFKKKQKNKTRKILTLTLSHFPKMKIIIPASVIYVMKENDSFVIPPPPFKFFDSKSFISS